MTENLNIEGYINDLTPELQEKARACNSIEELIDLADKNDLPLPDEAVEAVAGGKENMNDECPVRNNGWPHLCYIDDQNASWNIYKCKCCGKRFWKHK